ncbi:nucleotidyltransferase family protein [Pararhizobium arenae]|uniref:nucleotidyltransferase family protein n=1 Tax=Pararhizobium arenae TaxID=1856850 RepID=UPI00094B1272|nr:nucleotidyltransferase family protein [Pararhizobium arenae]
MPIHNAMVLAAGLGTRLRPITDTMPKPLVKIAGRPMIDYVLDLLQQAGVTKAVVNIHHFAEQMEAHLEGRKTPKILFSDERTQLMNSGGGLVKGLRLLEDGPVLVMNADLFWVGETPEKPSNLERLVSFFDPQKMDMALLCVRNEDTTGHNGKLDFSLAPDGTLSRYRDSMPNPVVYAGAIALDSRLFADAPSDAFNLNIYFDKAIEKGRLYGIVLDGHWMTVGTPEAIAPAEDAVRRFGA